MSIYDKASLVLIPSGTKTSKVYSQKPVNGDGDFTFSRSTAATRVNADGNIEKETQNFVRYSNDFSNWFYSTGSSATGGQSGYDGTNDAWLLNDSGVAAPTYATYRNFSTTGVLTMSLYAKAGTRDVVVFDITGTNGGQAEFNLTSGTLVSSSGAIDTTIKAVGAAGWYRCSVTCNPSSTIYTRIGAGGAGTIYLQDVQVEQGLVARDYIETTTAAVEGGVTDNVPRLDYTDSSCPSLKLEPQRTNKITQSEYFQSGWVDNGNISYDFGYLAPDGTNSAYKITGNDNGYISFAGVLNNDTRSVYARTTSGTGTLQLLTYFGNTNNTFTITEEWQRFDISSVTTSTGEANFYLADFRGSSSLDEVILWGAQCEAGSYATSYIPTYGTSVTRNADRAEVENGNNVLPTAYPFTLYSEMDVRAIGDEWGASLLNRNINNAYYVIGVNFSKKYSMLARNNTSSSVQSTANATEGTHKICGVFTETTLKLFVDGVLIGSSNNAQSLASAANDLLLGQLRIVSDTQIRNTIHQSLVFNQALTDQEAIDLTTI